MPGMFRVSQELRFCYGHRLLGHPGKCARLHGHNARLFVVLRAERVDANGMVIDFDTVEQRARGYLDEALDHRMLLQQGDPACAALAAIGEPFMTLDVPPTAENLVKLIYDQLVRFGLPVAEVRLEEQPGSIASYAMP
ncbi:MAG TPA: 6-carboxytetrahydropterin synthase [Myxococcales bacterium]|nr:6-carboxytetrahydropterin synthase [Myxococcales bacterium]